MGMQATRTAWRIAGWAWLALAVPCAWAAAVHTAAFTGGAEGWTNAGTLQLAATNQTLRGLFAAQTVPVPETGSWLATEAASGGAFAGDYAAAGIRLVGFSFMAQNALPSAAAVRWQGPTSSYFRSFASYLVATGVWYRFAFSLAGKDAGKWVGGSAAAFDEGLQAVQRLEIQVTRAGTAAQRYFIDDVFVDGLPVGEVNATGGVQVLWTSLRTNVAYAVQAADAPTGPWTPAGTFVAAGAAQVWTDPAPTNRQQVYRLLFDEAQ